MVGDVLVIVRFRIEAGADELWQTLQPGPISEKQAQWLRLQFCSVTVEVTEWIKCSQLIHLFLNNWHAKHRSQGQSQA